MVRVRSMVRIRVYIRVLIRVSGEGEGHTLDTIREHLG